MDFFFFIQRRDKLIYLDFQSFNTKPRRTVMFENKKKFNANFLTDVPLWQTYDKSMNANKTFWKNIKPFLSDKIPDKLLFPKAMILLLMIPKTLITHVLFTMTRCNHNL